MTPSDQDPTVPIRDKASRYAGVDEGTACTQSSFKTGKRAFLYIGMQGGRYKAMFKLNASLAEATKLAKKDPDRFQVGSTAWVTARFTADQPMPKKLWQKWLDESYELSNGPSAKKPLAKKKAAGKAAGRRKASQGGTKKKVVKSTRRKKAAKKK